MELAMSKGLSWRQRGMLKSIAGEARRWSKGDRKGQSGWSGSCHFLTLAIAIPTRPRRVADPRNSLRLDLEF